MGGKEPAHTRGGRGSRRRGRSVNQASSCQRNNQTPAFGALEEREEEINSP